MAYNKDNCGYLEIILGPMFSSKTTTLLEIYKHCKFCDIPVIIINHSLDTRYNDTMVSSHDKIMAPCIQTSLLGDVWTNVDDGIDNSISNDKDCKINQVRNSKVILINEGQFFSDLYDIVKDMINCGKKVYICGLDGDFERKKFGTILDLIPLCDNVRKLSSLCSLCKDGTLGIFSMRLTDEKEQTLIGVNNYIPVCRKCYDTKQEKQEK